LVMDPDPAPNPKYMLKLLKYCIFLSTENGKMTAVCEQIREEQQKNNI
jgi:hypothetical protein